MFSLKELEMFRDFLKADIQEENMETLKKIEEKLELVKDYDRKLWNFCWEYRRGGSVDGIFKATQEEIDNAIGKHVYFGEILGKHSEVCGNLEMDDLELISDDPLTVLNSDESGWNPLEYIDDYDE